VTVTRTTKFDFDCPFKL